MEQQTARALALEAPPAASSHLRVVLPQPLPSRLPVAPLWASICAGGVRVVEQRQEESRTLIALQEVGGPEPRHDALSARRRQMLELILSGLSENAVAIELGVAASTVCAEYKRAMKGLGLGTRLAALPLALVQLWHLAASGGSVAVYPEPADGSTTSQLTVVLPRPDLMLLDRLSRAELDVCRLLLQGASYAAISRERGTSPRTTANQLASVFSKLKVSGRLELVVRLVTYQSSKYLRVESSSDDCC